MKIVADAAIPFIHEYFDGYGDLILVSGRHMTHADVEDADILLVRSVTQVNEKLLANTQVKFVGSVTAGADHLDTKWLMQAGIAWCVAAGFNAPPVADYVMCVIGALIRDGTLTLHEIGPTATKRLKAAVIGVGNVGRLVAEKLKLLNFDVILCDPLRAEFEKDFPRIAINDINAVDFISLHVPLTKTNPHATYHFIDKTFLAKQKPGCILLNASRGSVINFSDLKQYGDHLCWCFDVWEHEPNIDKDVLAQAKIATPHIAGYSMQSKIRGISMIYQSACQAQFIKPKAISPIFMQDQLLSYTDAHLHWPDIIKDIFDPLSVTAMMRDALLQAKEPGQVFDEMRNQFNARYEFAFTKIVAPTLSAADARLLQQLGLTIA